MPEHAISSDSQLTPLILQLAQGELFKPATITLPLPVLPSLPGWLPFHQGRRA